MSHYEYGPVGYDFNVDHYCLDCIVKAVYKPSLYGLDENGRKRLVKSFGGGGVRKGACNCTECRLDRIATARGIDRIDERSYDSGDFPKAIPYHNDLHAECGPEYYGYEPGNPEWQLEYCDGKCARCHEVIGGSSQLHGPDVCPAFEKRME